MAVRNERRFAHGEAAHRPDEGAERRVDPNLAFFWRGVGAQEVQLTRGDRRAGLPMWKERVSGMLGAGVFVLASQSS